MWTEQTIETLKKFALEGRSAAWIAAALGAPSRNAVIGKANRIGVKLNGMRAAPFGDEAGLDVPPPLPWGRKRSPNAEGPAATKGGRPATPHGARRSPPHEAASLLSPARRDEQTDAFTVRPRSARCGGLGSPTSPTSSADGRSAIRRRTISPIAVFRSPRVTPTVPDTVGSSIGRQTHKAGRPPQARYLRR
jgi:hypothetical protein